MENNDEYKKKNRSQFVTSYQLLCLLPTHDSWKKIIEDISEIILQNAFQI